MAAAGSSGSEGSGSSTVAFDGSDEDSGAILDVDELGAPDCMLIGPGWRIPVHRCAHAALASLYILNSCCNPDELGLYKYFPSRQAEPAACMQE